MARDSRNVRKKRRQRRNLSLVSKQLRTISTQALRSHMTLVAVLAQLGGDTKVSKETMNKVTPQWGYQNSQNEDGTVTVRLVEPIDAPVSQVVASDQVGSQDSPIEQTTGAEVV
jgi:hypothetical protein